jgi:hypothetical protein
MTSPAATNDIDRRITQKPLSSSDNAAIQMPHAPRMNVSMAARGAPSIAGRIGEAVEDVGWLLLLALIIPLMILAVAVPVALIVRAVLEIARLL